MAHELKGLLPSHQRYFQFKSGNISSFRHVGVRWFFCCSSLFYHHSGKGLDILILLTGQNYSIFLQAEYLEYFLPVLNLYQIFVSVRISTAAQNPFESIFLKSMLLSFSPRK